jgi:hypothetical protein
MFFVKTFYGGGAEYDPRRKLYARFQCDVCNYELHIDITANGTFNVDKPRKCPSCLSFGKKDYIISLQSKKERLISEKQKIENEIHKICNEIQTLEISNATTM